MICWMTMSSSSARLVEWMLEPASPVGSPALAEIVEPNRRSTFGGAADEVAPEGDTVSVDDDWRARCPRSFQMQRRLGSGGTVPGTLVAFVVAAVQPDAARTPLDSLGQTAGDRLEHLVEVAGNREKTRRSSAAARPDDHARRRQWPCSSEGEGTLEKLAAPRSLHYSRVRIDRPLRHPLLATQTLTDGRSWTQAQHSEPRSLTTISPAGTTPRRTVVHRTMKACRQRW